MTRFGNNQNYNGALLAYAMDRKGWDAQQTAIEAGIAKNSVNAGVAGNLATLTTLRQLANTLGVTWKYLFDIDLPESQFRRAVTNGKRG